MHYLLFTTTHCPKCPSFKDYVQKNLHCEGKILNETDPSFAALSKEYMVNSVPTLFVFEDEAKELALLRTSDLAELYDFTQSHQ